MPRFRPSFLRPWPVAACIAAFAAGGFARAETPQAPPVGFNRDVRPILSDTCLKCHGPDAAKREGKLGLVTREGAVAPR